MRLSRRNFVRTGLIYVPWLVLPHDRVNCSTLLPIPTLEHDTYAWAYGTVKANAGSVSATSIMRANRLMQAIRTIRSKVLWLLPYVGNNLAACMSPIIHDVGTAAVNNTGFLEADFSESTGLTGDGTKFLLPGFAMTEMGTDDSTHLGIYVRTKTGTFGGNIGTYDGTNVDYCSYQTATCFGNMHGAATGVSTVDTAVAHYVVSRNASNDLQLYKNAASVSTQASPGGTRVNGTYPIMVHAYDAIGTAGAKQSGANAGAHAGTGLSAANVTLLYNALQQFNTSYGRQV